MKIFSQLFMKSMLKKNDFEEEEEEEESFEDEDIFQNNISNDEENNNENNTSYINDIEKNKEKAEKLEIGLFENYKDQIPQEFKDSLADKNWKILRSIMKNYNWSDQKIIQAHKGYIIWLTRSFNDLGIEFNIDDFDDNNLWDYLRRREEFRDLAEIRDCLIAIPASEAACERIFSVLKRIINPLANRTSEELEKARLTYLNF